ncbi:LacI family xylobiose transport system transcriptional regulator [Cryobacterium sp. MP_M5]|uniref:LacI family DNA-binding transcriptional regulator n=1 Tax=unclassified Cryobacterium TaxID=2649013 RepID=UPI0018CA1BFC|nr:MULTISPECIES: LacI family DNA-binding transcriptional regulator [unclassified Cryobacterium]MBG6056848.1 LacI family xylobiose transport system transcriptional regulator [Cryobacterium sp. MP_M3]MEC5175048.1 LacI family xylobiose transport system transcriptional regulator [Cryobacterium sp. MP_M5]
MGKTTAEDSERVTLAAISALAAVSLSTVSKVLNGRGDVAASTRSRVEALLTEHGYSRRGDAAASAPLLELVFHELESVWAIEIIRGVERVAREHGMSIILTESGDRHSPDLDWIDGVIARNPAGVILVFSDLSAGHKQQLATRGIPFVVVDPAGDPAPDVPSIGSANWSGGLAATRHLIDLGHTRIGMISGPFDMMCSSARIGGYRAALDAAGITFDPALVLEGDFHPEGARLRALELLERADRPTAIFAGSDLQAMGVYEAARALGLAIPADLSVVGYDDLPLARWVGPPLTTVRQPLTEMAEEAARLALRLRREPGLEVQRMDLATSLVSRQSTARVDQAVAGR